MNKIDTVTTEMERASYLDSIGSKIEKCTVHLPNMPGLSEYIHTVTLDKIQFPPTLIIIMVNKKHNIFR